MTPIPVEQALTLLLQAIHPIEAVERLPLGLACGRISAHTVLADCLNHLLTAAP
ncbi:MAG: hypothetical protein ACLUNX_08510 [Angelakisella sp.]